MVDKKDREDAEKIREEQLEDEAAILRGEDPDESIYEDDDEETVEEVTEEEDDEEDVGF